MPTTLGMRLVALEAISQWQRLPAPAQSLDAVRGLLYQQIEHSSLLKSAGTQASVAAYYDALMVQNPEGMMHLLRAADTAAITRALSSGDAEALTRASGGISKAFRKYIANTSITESYRDFLLQNPSIATGEPVGLSPEDIARVAVFEKQFREADRIDAAWGSVPVLGDMLRSMFGVGYPAVSHLIEPLEVTLQRSGQRAMAPMLKQETMVGPSTQIHSASVARDGVVQSGQNMQSSRGL